MHISNKSNQLTGGFFVSSAVVFSNTFDVDSSNSEFEATDVVDVEVGSSGIMAFAFFLPSFEP